MTQLWLRSSSFHEHGSSSGALGFYECGSGPGALFFVAPAAAPAFVGFHTLIFSIVLVCLKLIGK